MRRLAWITALLVPALVLLDRHSQAIPAFARTHDFSCTTCHDPFPRLTAYGEEFAGQAFKPGDQEMPPRSVRDVGDDELSLLKILPLAIRAEAFFELRSDPDKGDGFSDFKAPFGLKLLSGGRLAEDIGYYFYFYLSELSERGEVAGIEDAYLHFNDLFGTGLDLMIGQFQVSDPLFKRELRLTFQDYLLYKVLPGLSASSLTYDRGLMLTYGFDFGLDIAALIVNGSGKGGADVSQDFDPDRYKTYLVRLSQGIGPVRFGLVGYWSKEEREQSLEPGGQVVDSGERRANETAIWGADLTLSLGRAEINAQYLQRRDLNPYFRPTNAPAALLTHGLLVEAVAQVYGDPGKLFLVAQFNYVDSEATDADANPIREEAYTANLSYLLHTNIKLLAEYTFARFKRGAEINEHRSILGVVGAW